MLFPTKLLLGEVVWMVSCTESGVLVHGEVVWMVSCTESGVLVYGEVIWTVSCTESGVLVHGEVVRMASCTESGVLVYGEGILEIPCTESGDLVHGERVRLKDSSAFGLRMTKEPSALVFPGNVEEAAPARGGVILFDICHRHGNRDVGVNSFEGAGRALRRQAGRLSLFCPAIQNNAK